MATPVGEEAITSEIFPKERVMLMLVPYSSLDSSLHSFREQINGSEVRVFKQGRSKRNRKDFITALTTVSKTKVTT